MLDSAELVNKSIELMIKVEARKSPAYFFSEYQKKTYTTVGGTPHLDGTYTVFGEVISGMEVIDKIAAVKTNSNDRPVKDVRMKMRLEK
jgi:cyclophilin family peptidyl-prolyl cis-trans isomerase